MATFGELGNKLSKQLGKYEAMLNSTEPSEAEAASRMVPRLQAAMQKLMQGQEIFKAKRAQKDMAKGKSHEQMVKRHGEGYERYLQPMQEGGYVSELHYDDLDKFDMGANRYKGGNVYIPKNVAKDRMKAKDRSAEIFADLERMYPEADKIYSPQQLKDSGYADEYYDLYNFTKQYEEAMGKYRGTAGTDEYGKGDTTPLEEQMIGPRHHAFFDKDRKGVKEASAEEAAFINDLKAQGKLQRGGFVPQGFADGEIVGNNLGPDYGPYAPVQNNTPMNDGASGGHPIDQDWYAQKMLHRYGDTQAPNPNYSPTVPPQAGSPNPYMTPGFSDQIDGYVGMGSGNQGKPNFVPDYTTPEELVQLIEEVEAQGGTTEDKNGDKKYVIPDGLKGGKAKIKEFQKYAKERNGQILGSSGIDGIYGPLTAAAWLKYGKQYQDAKQGTNDPAADIQKEKIDYTPLEPSVQSLINSTHSADPQPKHLTGWQKFWGPQTTKVEEFLINKLGFPKLEGEKLTKALARQDRRLTKKSKNITDPVEYSAATLFNVDFNKLSKKEQRLYKKVHQRILDKQDETMTNLFNGPMVKGDVEGEDYFTPGQIKRGLRRGNPYMEQYVRDLESMTGGANKYMPQDPMEQAMNNPMYSAMEGELGPNYFSQYKKGGALPRYQEGGDTFDWNSGGGDDFTVDIDTGQYSTGTYDGDPVDYDWSASASGDNNYTWDDPSMDMSSSPDDKNINWDNTLSNVSKFLPLVGSIFGNTKSASSERDALDYANPSHGPIDYGKFETNPMAMAHMSRLKDAEAGLNRAWAKAAERRDFKVRPMIVDAKNKWKANKKAADNASGPMRFMLNSANNASLNDQLTSIRTNEQNTEAQWNDPGKLAQVWAQISGQKGAMGSQYGAIGQDFANVYNQAQQHKLMTDAMYRKLISADYVNKMNYDYNIAQMNNQRMRDQQALDAISGTSKHGGTQDFVEGFSV